MIPPNRCQLAFNSASLLTWKTLPLLYVVAASLDVHMDFLPHMHIIYMFGGFAETLRSGRPVINDKLWRPVAREIVEWTVAGRAHVFDAGTLSTRPPLH